MLKIADNHVLLTLSWAFSIVILKLYVKLPLQSGEKVPPNEFFYFFNIFQHTDT